MIRCRGSFEFSGFDVPTPLHNPKEEAKKRSRETVVAIQYAFDAQLNDQKFPHLDITGT